MGRGIKAGALLVAGCAALVAPATASAVNPVSFSAVGEMTVPRDGPGAAPLPDGKILVVGGCTGGVPNCPKSAEIFDPKTNTFSAAGVGAMSSEHWMPGTAKLPDGRVLVAGGWNGSDDIATAEVFNPSTKTFSLVGSLAIPRESPATAPLPDGRVLVAGGYSNTDDTNTTEIFNPTTNSFSPGPTLPETAYGSGGAAISGGRVLIAGGYHSPDYLTSAFAFNSSTGAFSPVGSLAAKRYAPPTASLGDGGALVAGGYDDSTSHYVGSAEIFDPRTNTFSSAGVGNLIEAREEAGAASLPDGRVLIAGGYGAAGGGSDLKTAEVMSVPSDSFKAKLKGRKVTFRVSNEGTGEVTDVTTSLATTAKKKKPKLLKTTTKHGGPGKIVVKIKLTKRGAAALASSGKLKIKVAYTPDRGKPAAKKLKLRG